MKVITRAQVIKTARKNGWKGKGLDSLKEYMEEIGVAAIEHGGEAIDLDASWAKTVTISYDSTEDDVVMEDMASADGEYEDDDEKAMEDEEEEKPAPKSRRATARDMMKAFGGPGSPAVHDSNSSQARRKRYESKSLRGETVYKDADSAEFMGAFFRQKIYGDKPYPERREDNAVIKNAQVSFDNSLGGALIPDGFIAQLIENKAEFGAAARIATITPMDLPKDEMPRLVDDVTVGYSSENQDSDGTNATFDTVTLVTHEISGYTEMSIRVLRGSALDVSDILSRSYNRALGRFEDRAYFLGDSKQTGILNKIGANSRVDVSGLSSDGLYGIEIADIQALQAKAPSWTDADRSDLAFSMTRQVYEATLGRFEVNAPGNTRSDLRDGYQDFPQADRVWNGYPVYFNNVTQKVYANDTIPILFGAFRRATKMGLWTGSPFFDVSEHAAFRRRNFAVRAGEDFAANPHDVNNDAGTDGDATTSGIVGLRVLN